MICLLNLSTALRLFFPTWVIFLAIFNANFCRANHQHDIPSQILENYGDEHARVLNFEAMHQRSNQRNEIVTEPTVRRTYNPNINTTCVSCKNRETYIKFNKEQIRIEILRKLNMREPPNVTMDLIPQHMIRQLTKNFEPHENRFQDQNSNMMGDDPNVGGSYEIEEEDDFHFQTRLINVLAKNGKDVDTLSNKITQRKEEIQYFDLNTPQIRDERWQNVEKAMLHMHLPNATDPHDTEVWIQVKMVMMNKHHGVIFKQKHNFKTELLPDQGGWIEIDVRDMVSHWMKGQNYGFTISVESAKGQKLNTSFQHQQQNGQTPFLQLKIRDSVWNTRKKRNLKNICNKNDDENEPGHCCLWEFEVDFIKEFGWNFVIFPSKYMANMCQGDCRLGKTAPDNPYTHILQQADKDMALCCTPKKMKNLEMLYVDENNNVLVGNLPNMKVERCGCA